MTKQPKNHKTTRRQHTPEFRAQALALAEKIGVAATARDLDLHESQIYDWRSKAQTQLAKSDLEKQQAVEIAKLKRQLVDKDEEVEILKKLQRISLKNCPDSAVAKYEFVHDYTSSFEIKTLCRVLNVSRGGFLPGGIDTHQVVRGKPRRPHSMAWCYKPSKHAKGAQDHQA